MNSAVPHGLPAAHGERTLRICIDARPLSSGHGLRGIGTYVGGLLAQFERLGQDSGDDQALQGVYLMRLGSYAERESAAARVAVAAGPKTEARVDQAVAGVAEVNVGAGRSAVITLEQAHCDVFHATSLEGIVISPYFRTIATLHDLIPLRMATWQTWARHPLERLAYLRQLRLLTQVDHIIAVSEATKSDACRLLGIAPERVSVILPAPHPARARIPTAEQMAAARAALDLRAPYFLAVASSDPNKNVDRVLEAFAALRALAGCPGKGGERYQQYRLYLVGTWMGHRARHLLALIERLGLSEVIVRLPWVPMEHLPALYHGAIALVFPSILEGFGSPVLEAMSCATAVITSNRSSPPEVARDAALYVTPESVSEIAVAMRALATDSGLRTALVARGAERVAWFGHERAARETLAVYRRVAEQERQVIRTALEWTGG